MQTLTYRTEQFDFPLGQRRGVSNLASFALDLSWARAETDCALSSTRAYPSPPMSGSPPPLPPKPNPEVGDRGQGGYQPVSHDAYRPSSTVPGGEYRAQPPQPPLLPPTTSAHRAYPPEGPERMPYPTYHRPDETMGRPMSYTQPLPGPMAPQPQYPLPPVVGPSLGPSPYAMAGNPSGAENPPFTSPKSQRKTKGHVASACVPCKRAHLRCDAQRPCSRCLSNGKEDSCVDVQHKKRGRPRLRDDNQPRFEAGARFPHPADPSIRRPVSLYSPMSAAVSASSYEDPLRRSHSYRVLKSQPSDPIAPRYIERGSAADANIYPTPLSIPSRAPEPVAFLTTDLEIAKASNTFVEAVGSRLILGRRLLDIVNPTERDRVVALRRSLQDEQASKEPNYLPPIFGKQEAERVIQALPFSPESISRFQLDRQDFFTFISGDGQLRPYPIRIGLAKEDSIYFVVLLIRPAQPFPHPSPSPHTREFSYSFQPQTYTQLTPVSGSFDPGRPRFGEPPREGGYTPRQPPTPAPLASGLTPGVSPNISSYSAAGPVRIEPQPGPSHHIPRSELSMARPPQQVEYQLPPIRGPGQPGPSGEASGWPRDDRSGRVDIGGLIEKPDPSRRGR